MPKAVMPVGGDWTCSLGSPGAGARAHHRFGSLTLLVVAPSSSQEQGDPRGDKSGSLTTPEIASFVSISPSTFRCETKALTGVTFFSLPVPVFTQPASLPFFFFQSYPTEWSLAPWPLAGGRLKKEKKMPLTPGRKRERVLS